MIDNILVKKMFYLLLYISFLEGKKKDNQILCILFYCSSLRGTILIVLSKFYTNYFDEVCYGGMFGIVHL